MITPGLWGDGWFYISALGLLVSGVLFFFLLGQYRVAAEAASEPLETEPAAEPVPFSPVYIPEEPPAPVPTVASVSAAPVEAPPKPAFKAEIPPPVERKDTTTGGISPAVVYLQNIKNQLEELQGAVRAVSQRVDFLARQDETLVARLGEVVKIVAEMKTPAPAPASVAAVPEPKVEVKPESKVEVKLEPKIDAKSEPKPDETIRLELSAVIESQLAEQTKKPAAEAPAAATEAQPPAAAPEAGEEKPRRGPVWPV